jgi:hypothetical protein
MILIFAVGLFGFSQESRAWSDDEIRSTIEESLKMRHPEETPDWWRSLGRNAPKIMISIFRGDSNTYHQIRLVDALAWFDDVETVEFLKDQAANHRNTIVKRSAIRSVGLSQGIKEKKFLRRALESSDPHTRLATANLLNELKDPGADKLVNEFIKTEKIDWVSSPLKQRRLSKENKLSETKLTIEGKRNR